MAEFTLITNTIRRPLELIERSVRASLAQGDSVQVVLVDQNEKPLAFPADVEGDPRFLHQHEPVPAVSQARNRAKIPPDCRWIIFCDDDGYLDAGYLAALKARINAHPEISIFAGGIRRIDTGDFYSRRHALGGDMKWFWNLKLLMGSNFCIKREVFEKLGKFDENFGAGARFGSSEETDFAWKAHFARVAMVYAPELVVFHIPPFTGDPGREIEKAYRYGVGKGVLVRKWLKRGQWQPILELIEMLILPLIQAAISVATGKLTDARLRWAGVRGRVRGLLGSAL